MRVPLGWLGEFVSWTGSVPALAEHGGRRPNKADHSARAKSLLPATSHMANTPFGSERHDDMRRN